PLLTVTLFTVYLHVALPIYANIHQDQADQMAEDISSNHPEVDTRKIYLDAFRQVQMPAGVTSPDTEREIVDMLDRGALIINYTGHGNEKLWAHERIFDDFVRSEEHTSELQSRE